MEALGDTDADAETDADREGLSDALADTEGDTEADSETDGLTDADSLRETLADGDTDAVLPGFVFRHNSRPSILAVMAVRGMVPSLASAVQTNVSLRMVPTMD